MSQTDLSSCSFTELADFLRHAQSPGVWSKSDFASLWAHQLNAPIWAELAAQGIESVEARANERHPTFGTVLLGTATSLSLVQLVKQYAQSHGPGGNAVLPAEIALMLYYLALAAARVIHRERITSMNDETLHEGWQWATRQEWIDSATRTRLENAMRDLSTESQT